MSARGVRYSVPGKVFLLGEYAVLAGSPALLAALPPRFELSSTATRADGVTSVSKFSSNSPAGRWIRSLSSPGRERVEALFFCDPLEGRGGFGASSAQFALVQAVDQALGSRDDWLAIWEEFRLLHADVSLSPSGADVVAQVFGGLCLFDPVEKTVADLGEHWSGRELLVFSTTRQAGRKIATHEHLNQLGEASPFFRERLEPLVREGVRAIERGNLDQLGNVFSSYASTLNEHGLEIAATQADREAFMALPGVLGVKGTGALQADGILVLTQPEERYQEAALALARSRGLEPLAINPMWEPGLQAIDNEKEMG